MGAALLLGLTLIVSGSVCIRSAVYQEGLDATKEWARLNDFPATATDVSIENTGSLFSREFTVSFVAPLEDITSWLNLSPGTKDITPSVTGAVRTYEIEPGGGAQHADVEVDERTGTVRINAYWS